MPPTHPKSDLAGLCTALRGPPENQLHHALPTELALPCYQGASESPTTQDSVWLAAARPSFCRGSEEEAQGPTKDLPKLV